MYSKLSKEELIEMLIENNNIIERLSKMHVLPIVNVQQFPAIELKEHKSDLSSNSVTTFSCTRER